MSLWLVIAPSTSFKAFSRCLVGVSGNRSFMLNYDLSLYHRVESFKGWLWLRLFLSIIFCYSASSLGSIFCYDFLFVIILYPATLWPWQNL
jgi:hypothetical protein